MKNKHIVSTNLNRNLSPKIIIKPRFLNLKNKNLIFKIHELNRTNSTYGPLVCCNYLQDIAIG